MNESWENMPTATPADIKRLIEAFCNHPEHSNWNPEFSFAHIALGDFNLSDAHLDFCLDLQTVLPWFYDKVAQEERIDGRQPASPEKWTEPGPYFYWIDATKTIIAFLQFLKTIPEPIREGVSDLDD
jgi:hypothetical protein